MFRDEDSAKTNLLDATDAKEKSSSTLITHNKSLYEALRARGLLQEPNEKRELNNEWMRRLNV